MNTLPSCDILQHPLKVFEGAQYQELLKLIQEYVGADCWALTIDDEVLFNSYTNESKTFKDIINETIIRDKIIENTHSLLVEVNRRKVNTRLEIYMFPKDFPFKLMIRYIADSKKWIIHRMNSSEYNKKYGEQNGI